METITFRQCTKEIIKGRFGLRATSEAPILVSWLQHAQTMELDSLEREIIRRYQAVFIERVDDWNEFELSEYFIGPLITFINFNTPYFCVFAERPLEVVVNDCLLTGKPDLMIASGETTPKTPYFCFSEYKKQIAPEGNPVYQAIGEMIAAQELNAHKHAVYGVAVIGRLWQFIVLHQNEYGVSHSFTADTDDLFDIFKILKALKVILIELARQDA